MTGAVDLRHASGRPTAAAHFDATNSATEQFFREGADTIAVACEAMAARFQKGGRVLVFGADAQHSDVSHVVVEFVHPVLVGKRALPAIPLPADSRAARRALSTHARSDDILMAIVANAGDELIGRLFRDAQSWGMLTLALVSAGFDEKCDCDYIFVVPSADPLVAQEVHEVLYHVLWELVHVFLDRRPAVA